MDILVLLEKCNEEKAWRLIEAQKGMG